MRYHNQMLLGLLLVFFAGLIAFVADVSFVAIPCAVVGLVLFFTLVESQSMINRASRAAIKQHYNAYVSALQAAQAASVSDLQGADAATVQAVSAKLIEAGKYMGSNPAWSNTRRIITTGDVVQWYVDGKAAADAALALIESYKKARQS